MIDRDPPIHCKKIRAQATGFRKTLQVEMTSILPLRSLVTPSDPRQTSSPTTYLPGTCSPWAQSLFYKDECLRGILVPLVKRRPLVCVEEDA